MTFKLILLAWAWFPADPEPLVWKETTRDIYINGQLSKAARCYRNGDFGGYAVWTPQSPKLILLKKEEDLLRLGSLAKRAYERSDDGLELQTNGDLKLSQSRFGTLLDTSNWLFRVRDQTILLTRHKGTGGTATAKQIWDTVPAWQSLMDRYQPDPEALATFKDIGVPTEIAVYLGTWCGDSKNYVPKLLKTLAQADNPNLKLSLHTIASGFSEPWQVIRDRRITNVPTVILSREGSEIGRFVERAQSETIEQDLSEILTGVYLPRDVKGKQNLIAEGIMKHHDGPSNPGVIEEWKIGRREKGGYMVFSRVHRGSTVTEVRLSTDETRKLKFLEITQRQEEQLRRTRYFIKENEITGVLRGSDTGIVRQTLSYQGHLVAETPALMVNGWLLGGSQLEATTVLVAGPIGGSLKKRMAPNVEKETLTLTTGTFESSRKTWPGQQWWFHEEGIPLQFQNRHLKGITSQFHWMEKAPSAY